MCYGFDIKMTWTKGNKKEDNVVDLGDYRRQKEKKELTELMNLVNDILHECPPESKAFYVSLEEMLSDELIK